MYRSMASLFLVFFSFLFAEKTVITVGGTGVTSLWTAYWLCKDFENAKGGKNVSIVIVGKWNWLEKLEEAKNAKIFAFDHEASGFGPMGIQPHSGLLWNTDNEVVGLVKSGIDRKEASFYSSSLLEEEGKEFLDLYTGWHERHLDMENDPASSFQRQKSLIDINRYARSLWQKFTDENGEDRFCLSLRGAWRIYNNPVHFANALNSLKILSVFDYSAEAIESSEELALQIPFYKEVILRENLKGIFFPDDGFIDSNRLRKFLWAYLLEEKEGKPKVSFCYESPIERLLVNQEGACIGVILENGEHIASDWTILAAGLGNKAIMKERGFELPYWNVWGAAGKAPLKTEKAPPRGGVSFHFQRCLTVAPDGNTMVIAGTSLVVPDGVTPDAELFVPKLKKNFVDIFGDLVDSDEIRYYVAPRMGIVDDLPVIGLNVPNIRGLIVLNPTSHLGNTQSIALGAIASSHVLNAFEGKEIRTCPLILERYRIDRFQEDIDQVRTDRKNGKYLIM